MYNAACARDNCYAQGPQLVVIVPTRELGVQTAMLVCACLSPVSLGPMACLLSQLHVIG